MSRFGVSHDAVTKEETGNQLRHRNHITFTRGRSAFWACLPLSILCAAVALLSACGTSSSSADMPRISATSTATAPNPASTDPSTVFVVQNGNSNGRVLALNAADGSVKWRSTAFAGGLGLGSLILSQGVVVAAETSGSIVALGAQDGKELWHTDALYPNSLNGSMVVDGVTVYIGRPGDSTHHGIVDAYRVTDGVLLWHYGADVCGPEFLAAASGMVVLSPSGCPHATITALSERDGSVLWQQPTQHFGAQVTIANGVIYTDDVGIVTALDAGTGATKWHYTPPQLLGMGGSSVSVSDQVVIAEAGTSILALRSQDGSLVWSAPLPHLVNGHAIVGNAVYASATGTVTALRLDDGSKLWQVSLHLPGSWSPAAVGDIVYVSVDEGPSEFPLPGELYAIRMTDGAVLWHYTPEDGSIGIGIPVVG